MYVIVLWRLVNSREKTYVQAVCSSVARYDVLVHI